MDIVLIARDRPELTQQTIESMRKNAVDWQRHRLLMVVDGDAADYDLREVRRVVRTQDSNRNESHVFTVRQLGVGGAKNFGARWFFSKYAYENQSTEDIGRHAGSLLMFSDNDMYYLPGWDERLELGLRGPIPIGVSTRRIGGVLGARCGYITQLGGWRHPFHSISQSHIDGLGSTNETRNEVDAVTGNCFVMRWSDWLKYGPFDSNAIGPGQSEDYALSRKIKDGRGIVATLDPPVAIHCGMVNSEGRQATGWEEMLTMALGQGRQWPDHKVMLAIPTPAPLAPLAASMNAYMPDGVAICHDSGGSFGNAAGNAADMADRTPIDVIESAIDFSGINHWLIPRREASIEEVREMYPAPKQEPIVDIIDSRIADTLAALRTSSDRLMFPAAINCGSGQRRFGGPGCPITWINVDKQCIPPDRVPDVVCDVGREKLPFSDGCMQYVVLHQVLEHFGCGESESMLKECWRVLKPGGSLIITVPDMRALAGRWLGGELSTQVYMTNVYGAYMGDEADRHKWGFDWTSLKQFLTTMFVETGCDEHFRDPRGDCWECGDGEIRPFDWRDIPGADIAKDWWVLGIEVVKP